MAVVAGLVVAQYFYTQVDREIHDRVVQMLQEAYPHLAVEVRAARLVEGEGIEIRGISIRDPQLTSEENELVWIDECFLHCNTDLRRLVQGPPQVRHVMLRQPTLRFIRTPDGWSTDRLFPLPKLGDGPAVGGTVENATVQLIDPHRDPPRLLTMRNIQVALTPRAGDDSVLELHGSLNGDYLQSGELEGWFNVKQNRWELRGQVTALEVCPELAANLPVACSRPLSGCGTLRGKADIEFQVGHDSSQAGHLHYSAGCRLYRGRLDDPRVPFPLTDLEANIQVSNAGIVVPNLVAKSGDAMFKIRGQTGGLAWPAPCAFRIEATSVPLTRRFHDSLTGKARDLWYQYMPSGLIDVSGEVAFDGQRWQPVGRVVCRDVSVSHYKFPYRVEAIRGDLTLRQDRLFIDLVGIAGGQPLRINGRVNNPGPEAAVDVSVSGRDLPIDEKLIRALPENVGAAVRSLHSRGTVELTSRLRREGGPDHPFEQHVEVGLNRCSVNYEKFPYPIGEIRGKLIGDGRTWIENGETVGRRWQWEFRDLVGVNDGGQINCHGTLQPLAPGKSELLLELSGTNVPLDDELRSALAPHHRVAWDDLRAQGIVDLQSTVRFVTGQPVEVQVEAKPREISVEPRYFPYRLDKLVGTARLKDGVVTLDQLRAQHGNITVSTKGECRFPANGQWQVKFVGFRVEGVRPDRDRDLMQALPERLRSAITSLRPSGPVDVQGTLELTAPDRRGEQPGVAWNTEVQMQQGRLETAGLKFNNVFGSVRLMGRADARNFECQGELDVDSVEYSDFQFTQLRGPLRIEPARVVFGSLDALEGRRQQANPQQRHITAKVSGGTIVGDAVVRLAGTPNYHLQARLIDADLARYALEMMPGKQKLNGRVMGVIDLQGVGNHTLRGEGRVVLREADVYELPIMVSLLSILSLKPPDSSAFSESDIDFHLVGDYIQFRQINFRGDAISLRGVGAMTLDGQLQLTFHTIVGRDEIRIPVIDRVIGRASQQLLEIQVTGTLDNPQTKRKFVPGVQQILNDLQSPPPRNSTRSFPSNGLR